MQKIITLFLCLLLINLLSAQNIIDKHYQNFVDQENSTVVHVSALTFQYAAQFVPENEEEQKEIKEFVQSIKSFDLVTVPDLATASAEYKNAMGKMGDGFEELLNVKDADGRFSVYIDEEDGVVYELVGVGYEPDEFIIFSLVGEMRLDQIGKMIGKMKSENLSPLKQINTSGVSDLKVYPNPVNAQGVLSIEIPDNMMGGKVSLINANGAKVGDAKVAGSIHEIQTSGLTPGYYFVTIDKDGVLMKKKVLVVR